MKSVKWCGRLFCCFASGFGQFATTQGGRAPHRGQVSPGADGGTALVGNHAWHRLPCLPLEHWWLTLREGHCARSVDLPNASFPLQGTRHSLSPSPVWCSSLPSRCRRVRQRDLATKDSQVGLGNVGTPPELLQKRRLITATALIQQIFFFFLLVLWKRSEVELCFLEHERRFRKHWRTSSPCGFDKREKRDLKQNFGSDHPNLWQGLET